MSKNIVSNFFKHIKLVSKHKWLVFKFSVKLGIPFRGLMHDLSKFSYDEFWESVKYYDGKVSPITKCKQENGYSKAWLHHKGRNKHHVQYWVDLGTKGVAPVIPYKYVVEMICDKLSASITYNGKNWTNSSEYEYWVKEKKRIIVNPKIENFLEEVFLNLKENGLEKILDKKYLKETYKNRRKISKYCSFRCRFSNSYKNNKFCKEISR